MIIIALKRKKYPVNIIIALKTEVWFPKTNFQLLSALKENPITIKNAKRAEGRTMQPLPLLLA